MVLPSFGSALASSTDESALDDLAAYMQPLCGLPACLAADGAHGPISSWFWNGWTPDLAGLSIHMGLLGFRHKTLAIQNTHRLLELVGMIFVLHLLRVGFPGASEMQRCHPNVVKRD